MTPCAPGRAAADGSWQTETPAWQLALDRTSDWHLIERWTDDVGGLFGDLADGTATISLYAHGDRRIEIACYPEHTDFDWDETPLRVSSQRTEWTVQLDADGEDQGPDSADISYEVGETFFDTLDQAQAEADRWGAMDESWWMRDGGLD